jgi:hypothetical protein
MAGEEGKQPLELKSQVCQNQEGMSPTSQSLLF